ncbi:hypothetical protein DFH08DRAFT_821678 [Mycena albidolilacea]|uniref:Uncharacterized protein n=1 Tax=Mycena albidolilacea TaxID=1033008 RepID=A0AAD6Z9H8_9AGAR|nr:hypothetical protein DFH08DRAFT_821678 [Mycena albidolilacea]
MTTLASLPEELLERILTHTVIAPPAPRPRAPWHQGNASTKDTRSCMAPLLVYPAFHRIALPFFYHTLVLHSPCQSASLQAALHAQPDLARGVRVLVLPSPSASDAAVISMLPKLLVLDITLPNSAEDVDDLTRAVRELRTLQELSVRKAAGTYLSQPAPCAMLDALTGAVLTSPQLVHYQHRLVLPPLWRPRPRHADHRLAAAPTLHTLCTPIPAMWAHAYTEVAANPALMRVCLGDAAAPATPSLVECGNVACAPAPVPMRATPIEHRATFTSFSGPESQPRPILPTALFLHAARPHACLSELICVGMHLAAGGWRGRSATVGGATA